MVDDATPAASPASTATRRQSRRRDVVGPERDGEAATDAAAPPDLDDPHLFVNRELSLLKFQERVLEEARDPRNPLLERVKFLAILGSNLGEFFMVRVAGLRQQVEAGVTELSTDGMTPAEQLAACRAGAARLMGEARSTWQALLPELAAAGIHVCDFDQLDKRQREAAVAFFTHTAFPVLTPLAFDPGRPFPHISNLSLNLAVSLRDESGHGLFARVKVPQSLPRLVTVPPPAKGGDRGARALYFVWLEQLIAAKLDELFPGTEILESHPFRVTRDAEMSIQELEADDLLETMEQGVRRRRFGSVVRLTVAAAMPDHMRRLLLENLDLEPEGLIAADPPLGMSGLNLGGLDRPDIKDKSFVPGLPPKLAGIDTDIFAAIRDGDILIHRPYDSFEPVIDWLQRAARDPDVLAIKMTLYRVGRDAPVVAALLDAARNGKEVAVLVELKARFDEESNIEWAKALEEEGVHVVYGLLGLKTHSKIALVVRREGESIRRYLHLGTGNYNTVTAQLYTDLDLFTRDDAMGADATELFNYLTGFSRSRDYNSFLVAPINLRQGFEALVRREIEHQREGRGGHLILKMNSLVDRRMIRLLYEASQAGVGVDLLVRGICCLRPGVPGVSDTVRVTSIVGRFLEHSRIYWFRNGGDETVYVGSADLMPRNIDGRVEILFPILNRKIVRRLREEILETYLHDNVKARHMLPDGTYERATPGPEGEALEAQEWFIAHRQTGRKDKRGKKKRKQRF